MSLCSESSGFGYQSARYYDFNEGYYTTNQKTKECRPTQIKIKENNKQKETTSKNKKLRSGNIQLSEGSTDLSSDEKSVLQQNLIYTNEDMKNYPFIDTDAFIPIVTWKSTKNCLHIISDISIPGCSPHSGINQRFKLNAESSRMSEKDIELLYHLIGNILFTNKVTISDVYACVIYILTIIKLSTNYHNGRHLNIDILFVKKIQMFVLSSAEDQCTHFETLFSKHTGMIYYSHSDRSSCHKDSRMYLPFWKELSMI